MREIPGYRERETATKAREARAMHTAAVAIRLARRVAILEHVVRTQSDEILVLRAIAGGVWAPEVGE